MSNTQYDIQRVCDSIKELLLQKNAKYGDSALEPVRCMSKSSAVEQILVRIDDKLSRISRGAGLIGDDEDVITDLIGYFVLLKIALERQDQKSITDSADSILLTEDQICPRTGLYTDYDISTLDFIAGDTQSFKFDDKRSRTDTTQDGECGWDPTTGPTC